eukprot:COSAG02_NODE_349_length_24073_cov_102.816092_13_plen_68_part_00
MVQWCEAHRLGRLLCFGRLIALALGACLAFLVDVYLDRTFFWTLHHEIGTTCHRVRSGARTDVQDGD